MVLFCPSWGNLMGMPSHPLGTGDSVRLIAGPRVWDTLTPALTGRAPVIAAVASIGRDADRLLPLSRGATLVVNAGDAAVRQGATDPEVLLRWHRAGVRVHSLDTLNATLILVDNNAPFVAAGSAHASQTSAQHLDEAVMVTDLPDTVIAARVTLGAFVFRSGAPMTEEQLLAAVSVFGADRIGPADADAELDIAPTEPEPESTTMTDQTNPTSAHEDTLTLEGPGNPVENASGSTDLASDPAAGRAGSVSADSSADAAVDVLAVDDAEDAAEFDDDGAAPSFPWARPHTMSLAQIADIDIAPSEDAQAELDRVRQEYGLPARRSGAVRREGSFSIEVVRVQERSDQPRPFGTQHRPGTHVIAVEAAVDAKRPRTVNQVRPPGRVVAQFRDELSYPRCHYYFLLVRHTGPQRVYKDVVQALKSVGETANFERSYMVQTKIDALLALWPTAVYD